MNSTPSDRQAITARVAELAQSQTSSEEVLAQTVEVLFTSHPNWDWVGIYLLADGELILGPYIGAPTEHERIAVGIGVCGSAVAQNSNRRIADVTELDNYLACSLETRSELVVLIRSRGACVGQFDIDSDTVNAFTDADERLLEELSVLVANHTRVLAEQARPDFRA